MKLVKLFSYSSLRVLLFPDIIAKESGISAVLSKPPFLSSTYLQSRFQYNGPVCKNTVKIEITTEKFLGKGVEHVVPQMFLIILLCGKGIFA